MLTKEQQKIIVETIKPFKPIRLAYNAYDSRENDRLELLYRLGENVSLLDTCGIMIDLEKQLNQKVNMVHFDYISPYSKKEVLQEAIPFYHDSKSKKQDRGTVLSY
ncbi:MAG: hypothetical protein OXE77_00035 [Flavobacteriaceae bacterium]|nr:hypothetical protein [Flavobacteriaceae bacterium]MCY4268420.1 hypothetical protein [Flavobacteriaceae bacterium]MCY4299561.1 hypothetical protein [Flavobacteriaceae bacterium]